MGEVEIQPNQVGYVASAGQAPEILVTVPGFFNHSIAPRNARRSTDPTPDVAGDSTEIVQGVRAENGVRLTRTRGPRVTPGTGMGPLASYTVAAGGGTAFGSSGNGVALDYSMATMTGSATEASGVKWETWTGMVVDSLMAKGTTYVLSADGVKTDATQLGALISGGVIASYTNKGGAQFVSNFEGTPGTFNPVNGLTVGVDFGKQMVTNYDLDVTVVGNWKASGSGAISQFTGPTGILLNGTCTGCSGGSSITASGTAHGTFVGPAADGLITTFGMSAGNKSISGASSLQQ